MPVDSLDLETSCYLVQGTKFEVDRRYKILEPMSHGAYGIVCSAEDGEGGETVAMKKIEGVFEHITVTKRTLRELRILRHLQHENLMQVKNIFITGAKRDFQEIYVVTELMETDMASALRSSQVLSDDHCQFFLYQILRGMKYVHSAQIIHRDLKPRSLLINSNCDLKIGDFALARVRFPEKEWVCPMTEYVCTRWYRAPEVLCSWTDYSCAIDIWSIGCILAEMQVREPLFPGHNTQHQLDLIIGVLGSPQDDELMKIPNEKCRKFIRGLPRTEGRPFAEAFAGMSPEARALLAKMLRWDPESRITVEDAIQDCYFEKLHCPEDEPTRSPLDTTVFEFERRKITASALREEIFRESLYYYPHLMEQFDKENGSGCDISKYRLLVPGESQDSSDEEEEEAAAQPAEELRVAVKPGSCLVFLCDRYDFSYAARGESLVLQAWFLDSPPSFVLQGAVEGNLEALSTVPKGPPLPRSDSIITLVGIGVRNPGHSDNVDKYWMCTRHTGGDGMLQIPFTRYDLEAYAEWRLDRQSAVSIGKMYCRHQGHLEGIELFDGSFFNISSAESAGMDPEQRLTLETSWMALHDAGFDRQKVQRSGSHIGVFVGVSGTDWHWVPLPPGVNGGMGATEAVIAGRVTFALNIKGPAQIINTACSASLVSMHSGKLHLLFPHDRMEAVLTTGISINTTPHVFFGNCTTSALSFMGRSFSFDKSADGFGRSEGTSANCFKICPYTDDLYGVLAGSQANHDGRSASLTAPNGPAQEKCIRSVLAETKLEPPEIDCFECHGTGTSLGDPIEVGAFKRLYNRKPRSNPVLATTSKTNLGHTEGGAGIAGFIKCIAMCMHTECAPNIHTRELNPHLDNEGFPCYFVNEGSVMTADSAYAGVSSFGVSGTNGHCLAYGRNSLTSRGAGQQNYNRTMLGKIKESSPNILTPGSDWTQWANLGRPHRDRPGTEYEVEALHDGTVTWRPKERQPLRKPEGPFFIRGSFNEWTMEQMSIDSSVIGLHTMEIELGDSGFELFQVVYNLDEKMVYYPGEKNCARKSAPMMGPGEPPSQEDAWLIRGQPHAYFRVEFFVFESGARQTISWLAVKD